jgi:hypothetical protein
VLIRHLRQLKTVIFPHRCLIHAVLFDVVKPDSSSQTNKLECFVRAGPFKPNLSEALCQTGNCDRDSRWTNTLAYWKSALLIEI